MIPLDVIEIREDAVAPHCRERTVGPPANLPVRPPRTTVLQEAGNWGVINLQKSTGSTRQFVRFTINLGIFSDRISSPFRAPSGGPPSIWICHFRERIGFLLPVRQDYWWEIDACTSVDALADEIRGHLMQVAVPEISRYVSDEALRDLWLSGRSPGETDLMRLRYLAVLLNRIGPEKHLEPTLEALRRYGVLANPGN